MESFKEIEEYCEQAKRLDKPYGQVCFELIWGDLTQWDVLSVPDKQRYLDGASKLTIFNSIRFLEAMIESDKAVARVKESEFTV